jgi:lipopolysaccharide export system permease protein
MILLLTRYILREYLKIFGLVFGSLLTLYFFIDLFDKIQRFLKLQVPMDLIIEYSLLQLPTTIFFLMPVTILLCSLLTLGSFSKHHEILAMKSCGVNLFSVVTPLLAIPFGISLFLLSSNLSFIPFTVERTKALKASLIEHKPMKTVFRQDKLWLRQDPQTIMNIGLFDPGPGVMYDVSIYKLSTSFQLEQTIEAKEIRYDGRQWIILSGTQRTFHDNGTIDIAAIQNQPIALDERPSDFQQLDLSEDAMKFSELKRYVDHLHRKGYPTSRYNVELQRKLAAPFMSLVMGMVAVPLGLMGRQGIGIAKGIGLSLLIAFCYWIFYTLCISLGRGGFLTPFLAGWLPHLSFLAIGVGWLAILRQ